MGRRKLDEKSETIRIQMVATRDWTTRVDRYAKKHKMSRSEAIRAIIKQALGDPPVLRPAPEIVAAAQRADPARAKPQ